MPRPPIGERAMTDAERQRKRRERLRKERGPVVETVQSLKSELGRARQKIAALRRQVAIARAALDVESED
jgi:hypothetical protein